MDKVPNVQIREICRVTKGMDERIDGRVLRWPGHIKKMEDDRIAKKVNVEECKDQRLLGQPRKRWTDFVNEFLRKRYLIAEQTMGMEYDRKTEYNT